ncbi:NAD(P)H-binding protein [Streptomyces radicis]|uniref:Epimerase n=1 Tax=Streptomyces radicis TaxID=1750517 RepID=A0A3A9W214_9ACTN|nr:NAD(P)H-binding protein [Streptomyces radicis]RKN06889.1 epimerase [Streptomyces radicis]RKN19507.1 epimerase [Streptomyces radicis]
MHVVVFGATGMIGHGALLAALDADDVTTVTAVVRRPLAVRHPKLREVVHDDFTDYGGVAERFAGADACFFCLGVSSAGLSEERYTEITRDYPLAAARALAEVNPRLAFVYVSGAGADPTSGTMWARVKGRAEEDLHATGLRVSAFRPAYIQPRRGARSATRAYRLLYGVLGPLYPVLRRLFPRHTTTTDAVGAAMLTVARGKVPTPRIAVTAEINHLAAAPA